MAGEQAAERGPGLSGFTVGDMPLVRRVAFDQCVAIARREADLRDDPDRFLDALFVQLAYAFGWQAGAVVRENETETDGSETSGPDTA